MTQPEDSTIVHAMFVIAGFDEDPTIITGLLGVKPDGSGRAGDKKSFANGRTFIVKDSYWELHASMGKDSLLLQDYILAVLARIEGFASELSKLPPHATRKVLIQASISKAGHVPGLYLESTVIDRLAKLGVAIDIDIN